MRRPSLPALRRFAALAGAAVLASACGLNGPSPAPPAKAEAPPSTHLVLRLGERRLYLDDHDPATPPESFPIAIGKPGRETPTGTYRVEEKVVNPDFLKIDPKDRSRVLKRFPPGPENPLGERWIGFIVGEGWVIGIHGTPHPELLGKAVSNGCVRMRNADVVRVFDHVDVGTPVIVEP
jgi:lipoprotein-anchoring transpeptidase ErfK/SrfK